MRRTNLGFNKMRRFFMILRYGCGGVWSQVGSVLRTSFILIVCAVSSLVAHAGINEWTGVGLWPEWVSSVAVSPENPNVIYVSAYDVWWDDNREGGLFKTTDGGATWDTLGFRNSSVNEVVLDPSNPENVWISNDTAGVWLSTDGGLAWQNRSHGMYLGGFDHFGVVPLAVCPHNSEYLLCNTHSGSNDGYCYFSCDGGLNWSWRPDVEAVGASFIAYDPAVPGVAYVTTQYLRVLQLSLDSGRTFQDTPPYTWETTWNIETAPQAPNNIWRATYEVGVKRSSDNGATWHTAIDRFAGTDTMIWHMDVIGSGDTIALAASHGPFITFDGGGTVIVLSNGHPPGDPVDYVRIITESPLTIWKTRRNGGIESYTVVDTSETSSDRRGTGINGNTMTIWPNPSSGDLWICSPVFAAGRARVDIYNILGQLVASQAIHAGSLQFNVTLPYSLASGVYIVTLHMPSQARAQDGHQVRVTITR